MVLCRTLEHETPLEEALTVPIHIVSDAVETLASAQIHWEADLRLCVHFYEKAGNILAEASRPRSSSVEEALERNAANTCFHRFYRCRDGLSYRRWALWRARVDDLLEMPEQPESVIETLSRAKVLIERNEQIFTESERGFARLLNRDVG